MTKVESNFKNKMSSAVTQLNKIVLEWGTQLDEGVMSVEQGFLREKENLALEKSKLDIERRRIQEREEKFEKSVREKKAKLAEKEKILKEKLSDENSEIKALREKVKKLEKELASKESEVEKISKLEEATNALKQENDKRKAKLKDVKGKAEKEEKRKEGKEKGKGKEGQAESWDEVAKQRTIEWTLNENFNTWIDPSTLKEEELKLQHTRKELEARELQVQKQLEEFKKREKSLEEREEEVDAKWLECLQRQKDIKDKERALKDQEKQAEVAKQAEAVKQAEVAEATWKPAKEFVQGLPKADSTRSEEKELKKSMRILDYVSGKGKPDTTLSILCYPKKFFKVKVGFRSNNPSAGAGKEEKVEIVGKGKGETQNDAVYDACKNIQQMLLKLPTSASTRVSSVKP